MSGKASGRLILVVDDEARVRSSVRAILEDEGYAAAEAADGGEALRKAAAEGPDAVLLDVWMPGMDGLEVLSALRSQDPDLPVVVMSGHGNIETAVRAVKLGAFDFLEKPLSLERLLLVLRNALAQRVLREQNRALREEKSAPAGMVAVSPVMRGILGQVAVVAPTGASVLITGENGTGKELLARALHAGSERSAGPFVEVNCAAIPETLIESELFGHERGAFTGAVARKRGRFDLADGGTIFLDEIGDMSLATQAKILRVLQERSFSRVGGDRRIEVDVRVVAATNKDLKAEIREGRFREDLFFRLDVFPFQLPPLRERPEDIPALAGRFLAEFGRAYGKGDLTLSPAALAAFSAWRWPGNVRELRNAVERMVILARGGEIGLDLVPPGIRAAEGAAPPGEVLRSSKEAGMAGTGGGAQWDALTYRAAREEFEREYLRARLAGCDGNISRTAAEVGLERTNLHRKLRALGIRSSRPVEKKAGKGGDGD
jgi:two-component system nitrogen regulation response regulator NtrX